MTFSTLTSIIPANNSTLLNGVITPQITVNRFDRPGYNVYYWCYISRTSDPVSDPNALISVIYVQEPYYGYPTDYTYTLPAVSGLGEGQWYIEVVGQYASLPYTGYINNSGLTNTFTITSEPSYTLTYPTGDPWIPFSGTTTNVRVVWTYNSTLAQSAYQVTVRKVSDNSLIHDTGKITSTATTADIPITAGNKGIQLKWTVKVWDVWDNASVPVVYETFTVADRATVVITSPASGAVVSVGTPSVTFTPTVANGREIVLAHASIWEAQTKIWEQSIYNSAGWASGTSLTIDDNTFMLEINRPYSYRVVAVDDKSIGSFEDVNNFSVLYPQAAAPNTPSASLTSYDTLGYIQLSWPSINKDADFYAWDIERRDDLLDPDSGALIETGTFKVIGRSYSELSTVVFKDYLAPSGYRVTYRIKQVVLEFGTFTSGLTGSNSNQVNPKTESYWLIAGDNGSAEIEVQKLWNVKGDSFTDEDEQSEFVILGRGRYIEKGSRLGVRGQLDLSLKNSGGVTARKKRLDLVDFQQSNESATLRNPFGDEYYVSVGNISVARIAGVGRSEFCDVSIPYVEVVK